MAYCPKRGDLVWLNFTPQAGHEQSGRRPAFVISHTDYNRKVGLALACPITNHKKGYPFEVDLPADVPVVGVVLVDQVRSLDWKIRQAALIAHPNPAFLTEVLSVLATLIEDAAV